MGAAIPRATPLSTTIPAITVTAVRRSCNRASSSAAGITTVPVRGDIGTMVPAGVVRRRDTGITGRIRSMAGGMTAIAADHRRKRMAAAGSRRRQAAGVRLAALRRSKRAAVRPCRERSAVCRRAGHRCRLRMAAAITAEIGAETKTVVAAVEVTVTRAAAPFHSAGKFSLASA